MKDFTGTTASEKKMFAAMQRALGIPANEWVGAQTMCTLAQRVGADCFPITLEIYGKPCIVARDIVVCNPKAGVGSFANSISGSFSDGIAPVSILVADGKAVREVSCHFWDKPGYPESVLYRAADGTIGIRRVRSYEELPKLKWAVGGFGLLSMYNPAAEGFTGKFADVLRRTAHTVLGEKDGWLYLLYLKNMTAAEVNSFCKSKLMLDRAIMLDGGHVAAINGAEKFAQINMGQKQLYLIQGVKA